VGARNLQAGADTAAARAYVAQVAGRAREGNVKDALELLRRHGGHDAFTLTTLEPAIDGICEFARERALSPEWQLAARGFCNITGLLDAEQAGTTVWDAFERSEYERTLQLWLRAELRRGISHLRDRGNVEDWLCACGVQGTLSEMLVQKLKTPSGEEVLRRALGDANYEQWLRSAREQGVQWLHELPLSADDIDDAVSPLLPGAWGDIEPTWKARQEFELFSYERTIAHALS
jgi:hypothetical protein